MHAENHVSLAGPRAYHEPYPARSHTSISPDAQRQRKEPLHPFVQSILPLLIVLKQVSCEYADIDGARKEALHALIFLCRQLIALLVYGACALLKGRSTLHACA